MFWTLRQFIPVDGKMPLALDKDGQWKAGDPHQPTNWMTHEEAKAVGFGVGFVFTENDPYFFIDLDKCAVDGQWTPEATEVFNMFPGAMVEVSRSGTGLHIIGRCDKSYLLDKRNKFNGWIEFYVRKRFVAFGPTGFNGDPELDFTQTLVERIPDREIVDEVVLNSGPVPEYTGPADDGVLLQKAISSGGSISQQFGTKASFKDLWEGNADVLCQAFPSPSNDTYDRSSADAALMSHLAFWTGKDAERMDRLFRRSALYREKYEKRTDYRTNTINRSVQGCRMVYNIQPNLPAVNINQEEQTFAEIMTVDQQIEHFKGCVYVRTQHRVMIPSGELLKPDQFNVMYGGYQFVVSPTNAGGCAKKAFEAFTESKAYRFPKVRDICFKPLHKPGAIIDDCVNMYQPIEVDSTPGDVEPFMGLLRKLLPHENDQKILLSYMAACVQYPGIKFQWAPVLQGVEGNGKTLLARCVEHAVGERYTFTPDAKKLGNQFNAYIEGRLFIIVEEVYLGDRRDLLDTMKPLITNDRIEVEKKGVDSRMCDNFANWWFCTNHRDAILKSESDRRYTVFYTAQQFAEDLRRDGMDGQYFPDLWNWFREVGFAHVAHYLKTVQIPDETNPATSCHRAPASSTQGEVLAESMGRAEQEVVEAMELAAPGFRNGWVSSTKLEELLFEKKIKMSPQKRGAMIRAMGFRVLQTYPRGRSPLALMEEDNKRPLLYNRSGTGTVEDYSRDQGYGAILPNPM